jgi:hypothetical protein
MMVGGRTDQTGGQTKTNCKAKLLSLSVSLEINLPTAWTTAGPFSSGRTRTAQATRECIPTRAGTTLNAKHHPAATTTSAFDTPEEAAQAVLQHYQNEHPEELKKLRALPLQVQEHRLIRSDKGKTGYKGVCPNKAPQKCRVVVKRCKAVWQRCW